MVQEREQEMMGGSIQADSSASQSPSEKRMWLVARMAQEWTLLPLKGNESMFDHVVSTADPPLLQPVSSRLCPI